MKNGSLLPDNIDVNSVRRITQAALTEITPNMREHKVRNKLKGWGSPRGPQHCRPELD